MEVEVELSALAGGLGGHMDPTLIAASQADQAEMAYWTLVATGGAAVVSAIGVAASLIIFALQARSSRRMHESQFLLQFVEKYGRPEMGVALKRLNDWWRDEGEAGLAKWIEARHRNVDWAMSLDADRRLVKSYFLMPVSLYRDGFIGKRLVQACVDRAGADTLLRIVWPMELAINTVSPPRWIRDLVPSLLKEHRFTGSLSQPLFKASASI